MPAVPYIAVAIAAYSTVKQQENASKARKLQQQAYEDQKKAQNEQEAINAQKRAEEMRAQFREERVKRARVIQAAADTGTLGSTGELGAVSNLATQRGANVGSNLGLGLHGASISDYNQNAADSLGSSQNHMVQANQWGQYSGMALQLGSNSSIFNNYGNNASTQTADAGMNVDTYVPDTSTSFV